MQRIASICKKNNLEEEMSRACSSLLIPFRIFHFHEIFAFDRKVKYKKQYSREIGLFATLIKVSIMLAFQIPELKAVHILVYT